MLEFLTLFLGLVAGPYEVALRVDSRVEVVRLELDGHKVSELRIEPWETEVDFGSELLPRELVATAFDSEGVEIDRSVQQINVPRPPAELSLFLERQGEAPPTALRVNWESRRGQPPVQMKVRLDGRLLATEFTERIPLPELDARHFHLLEVEVVFKSGLVARRTLGFGGPFMDEASSDLTAIAVELEDSREPSPAQWASWLRKGERGLKVVDVESGEAEAVFVVDRRARQAFQNLRGVPRPGGGSQASGVRETILKKVFTAAALTSDQSFRILIPQARRRPGRLLVNELFPITAPIGDQQGGVFWHVSADLGNAITDQPERLADAVAVAASQAATGNHRRAVVLVLGPGSKDHESRFAASTVRSYLAALRVPFTVWYVGRPKHAPEDWGPSTAFGNLAGLEAATAELSGLLERQRIAWIEGSHLPSTVELSAEARGIRLAR